jgi:DNA polymerase III subunit delta
MIYKSYLIEQNIELIDKKLFLFYGQNLGLKNDLKKKIRTFNDKAEIINLDQDEILKNDNNFLNDIYNISLFEKEKVYFINQADDKILNIIQEIETALDKQKIYFFSNMLEKKSKIRNFFEKSKNYGIAACYLDNEITIRKIVIDKLKRYENLSPENISMIVDNCSLDRDKLNNELDKIITFFSNKKLDKIQLNKLLNYKISDDFNLLKDEAMLGNKVKTNKLLSNTIMDIEKNILYLNQINQRFNKLLEVLHLCKKTSLENAINSLRPPIFWKDKPIFLTQIKKWNLNKIKNILKKTYNLEIEVKSNSIVNKNLLMKKLIIDICVLANS